MMKDDFGFRVLDEVAKHNRINNNQPIQEVTECKQQTVVECWAISYWKLLSLIVRKVNLYKVENCCY